jgi:predicted small lipoprotein YifL
LRTEQIAGFRLIFNCFARCCACADRAIELAFSILLQTLYSLERTPMIRTTFHFTSAALVIAALVVLPGCGGSNPPPAKKTPAKTGHFEGDGHDHSKDKHVHREGDGHDHEKAGTHK